MCEFQHQMTLECQAACCMADVHGNCGHVTHV